MAPVRAGPPPAGGRQPGPGAAPRPDGRAAAPRWPARYEPRSATTPATTSSWSARRTIRRERIDDIVDVPDWESYEPALRDRAAILVSWHLGNFEPFGIYPRGPRLPAAGAGRGDRAAGAVRVPRRTPRRAVGSTSCPSRGRVAPSSTASRTAGSWRSSATATCAGDGQPVVDLRPPDHHAHRPGVAGRQPAERRSWPAAACGSARTASAWSAPSSRFPTAATVGPTCASLVERLAPPLRARHRGGAGAVVGRLPAVLAGPAGDGA